MTINEQTRALVQALKDSPEYESFKQKQDKLKEDDTAKKMVADLRKIQWKIEKQKISGLEIPREDDEQLTRLMEVINLNTVVKEYLEVEYKFSVILNDIQKIIGEAMQEIFTPELWALDDN